MSRLLICVIAAASVVASAAPVLPEQFGNYRRTGAPTSVAPLDKDLWTEYGYEASEQADYTPSLRVTAWRFKDTTGAFAARQSESTAASSLVQNGNYLLRFENSPALTGAAIQQLAGKLAGWNSSPLPPLPGYLPAKGRVAGTDRYLLGPNALARFEGRIPRDTASFYRGAEASLARYKIGGEEVQLTVFQYPTPQMAIERMRQFEKLEGAAVARSGTLIAVVPDGKSSQAAVRLVEQVKYTPNLMWNEYVPKNTPQDAAKMILAISVLATGLIVASVVLGLFFGGGKVLAKRFGMRTAEEDFTSLHLGQ